jgi:hypothetical protein
VACPFFLPVHQIGPGPWDPAPRMPLGDTWAGECRSTSAAYTPGEAELRDMCNVGYVRGRCSRFPESAGADAVRFSLARGADNPETHVRFVFEKDHSPTEFGEIGPATDGREVLNGQARVFLESHPDRAGARRNKS